MVVSQVSLCSHTEENPQTALRVGHLFLRLLRALADNSIEFGANLLAYDSKMQCDTDLNLAVNLAKRRTCDEASKSVDERCSFSDSAFPVPRMHCCRFC
jgi:hypothetical protein